MNLAVRRSVLDFVFWISDLKGIDQQPAASSQQPETI
jgi:hypothetical protein